MTLWGKIVMGAEAAARGVLTCYAVDVGSSLLRTTSKCGD